MNKLGVFNTDLLASGIFPDVEGQSAPLWTDALNVYPDARGLKAIPGATLLSTFAETITEIKQNSVNGLQRAYIGGLTKAWYYTPSTQVEIANSLISTLRTRIETWGSWAVINNGQERPRLWKNTGTAGVMSYTPFTTAQHMKKFKIHMLAANTSNDANFLEWCSGDNIEDWNAANPGNTAGNLFVRDLDGPILGMFNLGQNLAMYANETLAVVSYLGNAFVLGAIPTVRGIGVWGGEAAVDLGGMNFGFGPQGLFKTDGNTFDYIGVDRVMNAVNNSIDKTRREETYVWHNEILRMVEFVFPDLSGNWQRYGYDYSRNEFWRFDKKLTRADERQVFNFALGAIDNVLVNLNTGTDWNGGAIAGFAQSKPNDLGDENRAKTINAVRVKGTLGTGLTLKVEALETPTSAGYTAYNAVVAYDNWFNAEAPYFKYRLSFATATSPFLINEIETLGVTTGLTG